jgi:hypothetical protein
MIPPLVDDAASVPSSQGVVGASAQTAMPAAVSAILADREVDCK